MTQTTALPNNRMNLAKPAPQTDRRGLWRLSSVRQTMEERSEQNAR